MSINPFFSNINLYVILVVFCTTEPVITRKMSCRFNLMSGCIVYTPIPVTILAPLATRPIFYPYKTSEFFIAFHTFVL